MSYPLRFFLFFTTLFDPLGDDVAVVTAERVSPFPMTAGTLNLFQGSSTVQCGITRTWTSSRRSVEHSEPVLGSAAPPAIVRDPCFSMARDQEPHGGVIHERRAHHDVGHREHHQAAENHDEHHGILEHLHDVEGLMRNKVALPLPRHELDGMGKLDGRRRVQRSADCVGTHFERGFRLWRDIDAELQVSRSERGGLGKPEKTHGGVDRLCRRHDHGI